MKILLATRVWPEQRPGGMAFVCQDRATELARQGHEVHVVTTALSPTPDATPAGRVREETGVVVHYTATPAHRWSLQFANACAEETQKLRPKIVHSESFDRNNLWWPNGKARIAVTMHGFLLGAWLTAWNEHRALGKNLPPLPAEGIQHEALSLSTADVVLGTSLWEWRLLRDQYGLVARLVYNPIAPAFFETPPASSRKLRDGFLCAAVTGSHRRGFRRAEEAARKAGVQLLMVSDVPRSEMPAVYDRVRAVVLPTAFCQGYDLTIAEARARAVPAIMTPTGSYLDEAQDWDRLVPLGDGEALASELRDFRCGAVPKGAADAHRPERHVESWLAAVLG